MANEKTKIMPVDEGLKHVGKYIQKQYIAEKLGKHQNLISMAISHSPLRGVPYHTPEDIIKKLNDAIHEIASELRKVKLSHMESIIVADQIANIRRKYNMTYIATEMMGRPASWLKRRTSTAPDNNNGLKGFNYHNKFTQEDVDLFNEKFQEIAEELSNIMLISDKPQE